MLCHSYVISFIWMLCYSYVIPLIWMLFHSYENYLVELGAHQLNGHNIDNTITGHNMPLCNYSTLRQFLFKYVSILTHQPSNFWNEKWKVEVLQNAAFTKIKERTQKLFSTFCPILWQKFPEFLKVSGLIFYHFRCVYVQRFSWLKKTDFSLYFGKALFTNFTTAFNLN